MKWRRYTREEWKFYWIGYAVAALTISLLAALFRR